MCALQDTVARKQQHLKQVYQKLQARSGFIDNLMQVETARLALLTQRLPSLPKPAFFKGDNSPIDQQTLLVLDLVPRSTYLVLSLP